MLYEISIAIFSTSWKIKGYLQREIKEFEILILRTVVLLLFQKSPQGTAPRRFAIPRRNRWMVEAADVVVACVLHDWGGAAATLRYARQKGKQIISYEQPQALPRITKK